MSAVTARVTKSTLNYGHSIPYKNYRRNERVNKSLSA